MNKEEVEKLAGRVTMKMNLKKEVREMGKTRPCTATRVGSDSPQRQYLKRILLHKKYKEGIFKSFTMMFSMHLSLIFLSCIVL